MASDNYFIQMRLKRQEELRDFYKQEAEEINERLNEEDKKARFKFDSREEEWLEETIRGSAWV